MVYSKVNGVHGHNNLYGIIIDGNKIQGYHLYLDFEQKDPVFDEDCKPIYRKIPITLQELIRGAPLVYTIIDNEKHVWVYSMKKMHWKYFQSLNKSKQT